MDSNASYDPFEITSKPKRERVEYFKDSDLIAAIRIAAENDPNIAQLVGQQNVPTSNARPR